MGNPGAVNPGYLLAALFLVLVLAFAVLRMCCTLVCSGYCFLRFLNLLAFVCYDFESD